MVVEYGGYLIKQSDDVPEASVYRGNRIVMHLSLTGFLEPAELKATVEECMKISGMRQQDEMNECGDYMYDGEEPC